MITVYLGDVTDYLSQQAIASDSSARLITTENYKDLKAGTYYTSLGDLNNFLIFSEVLQQADCIVYAPPESNWSDDQFGKSYMKIWTEDYLNVFRFRCKVKNYTPESNFDQLLSIADIRKTDAPQLWIAGCSISHGFGVSNDKRYGQLLANRLSSEVSFLTKSGSSIAWAADQILRSDIRPGDTVVWGLTFYARLTKFKTNNFEYISVGQEQASPFIKEYLTSDQVLYHSVISVCQVINFCKKINVKLILASVLDAHVVNYIHNFPDIVMLGGLWGRGDELQFLDLGSDNQHPGVKTHEFYAEQIYQKIQNSVVTK